MNIFTCSSNKTIAKKLDHLIKLLNYPSKTIRKFRDFAFLLKNDNACPLLFDCDEALKAARYAYSTGSLSVNQVTQTEVMVIKKLSESIIREISIPEIFNILDDSLYELDKILDQKLANCLGIAQIIYFLGGSINLTVNVIEVVELRDDRHISPTPEIGHVACIIGLSDGSVNMIDLAIRPVIISERISIEKEFRADGAYLQLVNPLQNPNLHKRIQILQSNGIVACIYNSRGLIYHYRGQFKKAIRCYNKGLKSYPSYNKIFSNRGMAYDKLKRFDKAITDFNHAIRLNEVNPVAFNNRGFTYYELGNFRSALLDYNRAISLNPKYALAYLNRGVIYHKLGKYNSAQSDYSNAILFNPKDQLARRNMQILISNMRHS